MTVLEGNDIRFTADVPERFFAGGWTIAGIVLDAQINLSREGYQS